MKGILLDSSYAIRPSTSAADRYVDVAWDRLSVISPTLAFLTAMVVLAANSNQPALVDLTANLRFVLYGALILAAFSGRRTYGRLPVGLVFVLISLVALALCSVVWTMTPLVSLERAVGFALLIASVTLVSLRAWPDLGAARRCFSGIAIAVTIFLAAGLILFATGWPGAYELGSVAQLRRMTGVLVSPNSIGVVVGLFLPILLGMRRSAASSLRWTHDLALGIAVVSLVLSQSRGGALAAAVGVIAYVLLDRTLDRTKAVVAGFAVVLAGAAFLTMVPEARPGVLADLEQRFASRQPNSEGGSGRVAAWDLAVEVWRERPVAGWGFGSADAVFGPRSVEIEQVFQGNNPHNSYFNTLLELGLGGVIILVAAVAVPLVRAVTRRREPFVAGLAGAVCAGVTISMFESGLTAPGSFLGFAFWFVAIGLVRITDLE